MPVFGWAGRGTPSLISLSTDIDTIVAGLPALSSTGIAVPDAAELISIYDSFNPYMGFNAGSNVNGGGSYETMAVYQDDYSPYGREAARLVAAS